MSYHRKNNVEQKKPDTSIECGCTSEMAKLICGVRSQHSRDGVSDGGRKKTPLGLLVFQDDLLLDLSAGYIVVFILCTFPFVCYITIYIYLLL